MFSLTSHLVIANKCVDFETIKTGEDHQPPSSIAHKYVISRNDDKVDRLVEFFRERALKRALVLLGGQSRINDFVVALQARYVLCV